MGITVGILAEFRWSEDVVMMMTRGDVTATGMAILHMDAGFRALPVDPGTKRPFPWLTPHGVRDATDDVTTLKQWFAVAGAHDGHAGLGIVPGAGFAIVDDDTGELDIRALGLQGTFSERTRRGCHHWARLPNQRRLRKSRLRDGVGDLITGDRAYVVVSPTPSYFPIDPKAPIFTLPGDSPLWESSAPRNTLATSSSTTTPGDRNHAHALVSRMLEHSTYRETVAMILQDRWATTYHSRSEADAALVFLASHFLRDQERAGEILTAILQRHSLKAKSHANPDHYIAMTVAKTRAHRTQTDAQRIATFTTRYVTPSLSMPSPEPFTPKNVNDAKFVKRGERSNVLNAVILGFAAWDEEDEFTRDDNWRRIPVQDVADIFGVSRETVRLRLVALEKRGEIERRAPSPFHDGRIRRDSLVRVVKGR